MDIYARVRYKGHTKIIYLRGRNGDVMRHLVDDVKFFYCQLVDFVQNIYTRYVLSIIFWQNKQITIFLDFTWNKIDRGAAHQWRQ